MPTRQRHRSRRGAGASAQRMADRARRTELRSQHRRAALLLPPVLAIVAGLGYVSARAAGVWWAGLPIAIPLALLALGRLYRSAGSTWSVGACGERKTGRILAPLVWFSFGRWDVLHDRRAGPNSRANLDHIVLSPAGPIYVDTKTWTAKGACVRLDPKGNLWYGRWPQNGTLSTVLWEADRVQQVLGSPVRAVIAVHHAHVPRGGLHIGPVAVIPAARLRPYLRTLPRMPGWDRGAVRRARKLADVLLPEYDD